MRAQRLALAIGVLLVAGGCEEKQGFLKIESDVLFNETDRLACGEARIAPQGGGLLDAFITLKPQDCMLTLLRPGDFLGFGTKLCEVHIGTNRITTVYLTESRSGVSCGFGST